LVLLVALLLLLIDGDDDDDDDDADAGFVGGVVILSGVAIGLFMASFLSLRIAAVLALNEVNNVHTTIAIKHTTARHLNDKSARGRTIITSQPAVKYGQMDSLLKFQQNSGIRRRGPEVEKKRESEKKHQNQSVTKKEKEVREIAVGAGG
jgi:hypothetical protein